MRRGRTIVLVVTAAFLACILLLAGGMALIPASFPLVVPWVARQMVANPTQVWSFFVAAYNGHAAAEPDASAALQQALAAYCTVEAQVDWNQWQDLAVTVGAITNYTLTLTAQDPAYAQGRAWLNFQQGHARCYEVVFERSNESCLIHALRPCSAVEDAE